MVTGAVGLNRRHAPIEAFISEGSLRNQLGVGGICPIAQSKMARSLPVELFFHNAPDPRKGSNPLVAMADFDPRCSTSTRPFVTLQGRPFAHRTHLTHRRRG